MIIRQFTGGSENEAIAMAKKELGDDAVITNIGLKKPKGFFGRFKKKQYEVTACLDENPPKQLPSRTESIREMLKGNPDIIFDDEKEEKAKEKESARMSALASTEQLEAKISDIASMLQKQIGDQKNDAGDSVNELSENDNNMSCLQLIYNQLSDKEVDEKYINQLISEIEPTLKKDTPVENILSSIYQKIVLKLGKTEVLGITHGKQRYVFFIGPTGVGKTTTIAKLASKLTLDRKLKVALLTADTYRVAAVEQLSKYAGILQIPIKVIYTPEEMEKAYEEIKGFDIVLVDTAGRSHRDKKQRDDIEKLISYIPEEERDIFLVLSVTTKYRDLIKITEAYSEIASYRLVFTKLDETDTLGNIFNVRLLTGAPLSYATFGQNVPSDISRIDAQSIAKHLLGGNE